MQSLPPPESFRGIVHFVTAAESQSFTAAAERLGITKSAIGKSITQLEHRLGAQLFHRTTRKNSLTTEGEAYLISCLNALEILQTAERELHSNSTEPSGTVRIDVPAFFGRSVIMPVLMKMAEHHPQLKLTVTFNDHVIDPVDAGFDLAIRYGIVKDSTDLVAKKLNDQSLAICAAPGYLEKYGTPETQDDLGSHKLIMAWRKGTPLSWILKDHDGQDVKFKPTPFHQISDGDAMVDTCLSGAGIIQFPEPLLRPMIERGKLVPILPELTPAPIELNVIWPRSQHLLPGVRFVVDELFSMAQDKKFD